ncbi:MULTISPECIES: hypothetical protein [unclassified Diaminobutyricimonas]|uniref:hypothetical protein n=1 Tax=unclassified Diaminobutyricimonas TaxID=2643261 RepID=UPI0012F4AB46|nr:MULTISPECIES: hypothetical protein [unclassified Diaminobutyricimonas]
MNAEPATHHVGKNETKLRISKTREELEDTIETIRGRLDFKTHGLRVWASIRRDVRATPRAYVLFAIVAGSVGVFVISAVIRERMHRG